jgi:putative endonuclease
MPPSGSKPKRPERQLAESFGRRSEWAAAWYLRLKGYRIRDTRVKTPVGEIDLVAERFGVIVFVEVKARARRDSDFDPLYAVNVNRIVRAAQYYLARHPRIAGRDLRFDVILLAPMTWPRHVVDAFAAS